jgi:hypothetical protein
MPLGELFTSAVVHTVVGEALRPGVQGLLSPAQTSNMGALESGGAQPETLASESNFICLLVWGAAGYFFAKYMRWI